MLPVLNNYRSIQVLPTKLANQIAAGEVIERPASCIKELLENSLDAGATEVRIDIDAGGMRLISVTDNGVGITKEDLPLTIAPHATSKIREQQDLFHLLTLGFRGEALASIQAVSKVEVISKRPDADAKAYVLKAYDQNSISEAYFSGKHGTTVIIKDLFYNVPARKKFLKSAKTEYLHIESLVTALALSRPEVAIYFSHNQKLVYHLPQAKTSEQLQTRVTKLLGKRFVDHAIEINVEKTGLKLRGFLGLPETFLRTNQQQFFYINGRLIKDKLITHAIKSFFQEKQLLSAGMYPAYVLYFAVHPEDVDVNVHPTKHEVRFHEPRLIHDFITSSLASVVKQTGLISEVEEFIESTPEYSRAEIRHHEYKAPSLKTHDNVSEKTHKPVLLKQFNAPSYTPIPDDPKALAPLIKIGHYLLLGGTIEQPEQGKIIDLNLGQKDLLSYFLAEQHHDWFVAKPMLVSLTIETPHTEQWLWPDKQNYFATHFGLIYHFKQKNELVITHLPHMLKYLSHQERLVYLTRLFNQALHNGEAEWHAAIINDLPEAFLSRVPLAEWVEQTNMLTMIDNQKFVRPFQTVDIKKYFVDI